MGRRSTLWLRRPLILRSVSVCVLLCVFVSFLHCYAKAGKSFSKWYKKVFRNVKSFLFKSPWRIKSRFPEHVRPSCTDRSAAALDEVTTVCRNPMCLCVGVCVCVCLVQVTALVKLKECEDTHLGEEVDRNWAEVVTQQFVFDRLNREVKTTHTQIVSQIDMHTSLLCFWVPCIDS